MRRKLLPPEILIYSNGGRLRIFQCPKAEKEHKNNPRVFAHVFHKKGVMCVADDFFKLPEPNQAGIIWHEIGHIFTEFVDELNESDAEIMADYAAEEVFDTRIFYDYNKIQWVEEEDVNRIEFEGDQRNVVIIPGI